MVRPSDSSSDDTLAGGFQDGRDQLGVLSDQVGDAALEGLDCLGHLVDDVDDSSGMEILDSRRSQRNGP